VNLAMDAKTGQICAALTTNQDVDDASVLPDLLDQIPADLPVEIVGGDGAYDTKQAHAVIAARGAQRSIPPREGAKARCRGRKTRPAQLAQQGHRIDRQKRPLRMKEVRRLTPALACREPDVPAQDAHGQSPAGATHRFAGNRSRDPHGRAQPHDGSRSPALRSHCLNSASKDHLCLQIRFMQKRLSGRYFLHLKKAHTPHSEHQVGNVSRSAPKLAICGRRRRSADWSLRSTTDADPDSEHKNRMKIEQAKKVAFLFPAACDEVLRTPCAIDGKSCEFY
jgi:hypothetical protein